ncbi:DegV family EDD domain-containing protein [Alkalibaculum sp. M08DMB]|uniref:DegV family EDD domain-containing protein n=1 Tax=Alkalibaculum sporogenes TaxID=2655001 RepID=A0A6A7KAM2_9FIRM|nr:DegV family protein [Alkalibaculum sporogenes]MPW26568.1 DegV family EDD domain-containing protein [Alkalibaculum sporogenes]
MSDIKIITDSASDLPIEIIRQYDIDVLPLSVIEGDTEYKDGATITPEEVFEKMRKGISLKTSQVTTNDYYQKFEEYILKGKDCIYIGFSSNLSGCYQSSILARDQLSEKYGADKLNLHIYDTKCASLGFGLVVLEAAKKAKQGKTTQEVLEIIDYYSNNIEHIFTVFDLDYLHKGGRLKKSTAVLGNLLNIFPILHVVDGNLQLLETVRGRKKHMKRVMELVDERGKDLDNQTVGIVHGDNIELAEELKSVFQERYNTKDFIIRPVGAVIGAHTGPEMFSLFFLKK